MKRGSRKMGCILNWKNIFDCQSSSSSRCHGCDDIPCLCYKTHILYYSQYSQRLGFWCPCSLHHRVINRNDVEFAGWTGHYLPGGWIGITLPSQCWEMIGNANIFLCLYMNSVGQGFAHQEVCNLLGSLLWTGLSSPSDTSLWQEVPHWPCNDHSPTLCSSAHVLAMH